MQEYFHSSVTHHLQKPCQLKRGENSIYNYFVLLDIKAPLTTFRMNKLDLLIIHTIQTMRVKACSGAVRLNEMAEARVFIKTQLKYHKFIVHDTFLLLTQSST
jgi:hypothetical protein